jgi:hypothetical protein
MQMLQTVTKISCSKFKGFSSLLVAGFSSNKDPNSPNPWPVNSLDLPPKQPTYEHKANYNFEQYGKYTKARKQAEELKKKEDAIELKIKSREVLPRRKRRLYVAPKHDTNIEKYAVWRVFDRELVKFHPHSMPVVCKIPLAPKYLQKVFGKGKDPTKNAASTLEYDFEDNNLDLFILYDFAATTQHWGPNRVDYDYNNQENIHPRKRVKQWPTPEEFWNSEEEHLFRLNCSEYADFRKFKKWIISRVNEAKTKESFDESVKKVHGDFELFDDYSKKYEIKHDPAIFKYTMNYFLESGEKFIKKTRFHDKLEPAKKLDDKHKITSVAEQGSAKVATK